MVCMVYPLGLPGATPGMLPDAVGCGCAGSTGKACTQALSVSSTSKSQASRCIPGAFHVLAPCSLFNAAVNARHLSRFAFAQAAASYAYDACFCIGVALLCPLGIFCISVDFVLHGVPLMCRYMKNDFGISLPNLCSAVHAFL